MPNQLERRRARRYLFGGVAEVTASRSGESLTASTREISRYGCFVETKTALHSGETVSLRIVYDGREFVVPGEVAYVLPHGMGVAFGAIPAGDQAVLENWLAAITV
jgi:hypothetical protein